MPFLTLRYPGLDVYPAPRPKPTKRGKHCGLYNPPEYTKYMDNLYLATCADLQQREIDVNNLYLDYILYEFGIVNTGKDNDNCIKGIQDALQKKEQGEPLLGGDTALWIPLTTVVFFPLVKETVFTQVTMVYHGTDQEYERYRRYRDKRERLSLSMIKERRKELKM